MNETDIKRSIKDYLNLSGWYNFYFLQGMGSFRGLPDLAAIKNGNVLWIEVKTEKGRQSKYQKNFEKEIRLNGGHYILARSYKDVDRYIVNYFGEKSLLL